MTRLVLVTAGTGTPSSSRLLGERLAQASVAALDSVRPGTTLTHLELRTLAVDLAQHSATRVPSAALSEAFEAIRSADGVIAVTPVYNGSYTGVFKLFVDALDTDLMRGRPVLLGATGGTARHSFVIDHALVPLFFYLKAPVAPLGVYAATEDWGDAGGRLEQRIQAAAAAFAPLVRSGSPSKVSREFESPNFEDLLRG
ncbi:MAG: CE1759 family FMN reductase [Propionicimonas sp.]